MNRSDLVLERSGRAAESSLQTPHLRDALLQSLRRGRRIVPRRGHEYRRGRCLCGVLLANHFDGSNQFRGCGELAKGSR